MYDAKDELVVTALKIGDIVRHYVDAAHELEGAIYYLHKNHEICHAIGLDEVEGQMTCESQLESALYEAIRLNRVSELDQLSRKYIQAMKGCGLPMEPAFPDKLEKLLYPNDLLKELKL